MKFKVGDKVRWQYCFLDTLFWDKAQVISVHPKNPYFGYLVCNLTTGEVLAAQETELTLLSKREERWMIKGNVLVSPVHNDEASARAELERLTKAHPNQKFILFKAVEEHVGIPTTTYETKVTKF